MFNGYITRNMAAAELVRAVDTDPASSARERALVEALVDQARELAAYGRLATEYAGEHAEVAELESTLQQGAGALDRLSALIDVAESNLGTMDVEMFTDWVLEMSKADEGGHR